MSTYVGWKIFAVFLICVTLTLNAFYYVLMKDLNYRVWMNYLLMDPHGATGELNNDIGRLKWHKVEPVENASSYVLAAFYDHRIKKIVVFLASEIGDKLDDSKNLPYICRLYFDNDIDGSDVDGYFFSGFMLYCPLPPNNKTRIPSFISINRKENDTIFNNNNWTIPITDLSIRQRQKPKGKTAMCVGILFGYQNWLMLLQYIEFHRMRGVEKLIFFYSDLHDSSKEIFDWYRKMYDFVEIVEWRPFQFLWDDNYLCQLLRNNFCIYSLMYKYKYVGLSDFDELYFPFDNRTLDVILDDMNRDNRGSFTFQAKYHQRLKPDWPQWNEIAMENVTNAVQNHLPLFRFNNVSSLVPHYYSPKVFLKPETVLLFVVHSTYTFVDGVSDFSVPSDVGFLRHFKIRKLWGGWADDADKIVNFTVIDPWLEVGAETLTTLMVNITKSVKAIKAF